MGSYVDSYNEWKKKQQAGTQQAGTQGQTKAPDDPSLSYVQSYSAWKAQNAEKDTGTLPAQTTTTTTAQPESGGNLFLQWLKKLGETGNNVDPYAGYQTDDVTIANAKQPTTERAPVIGSLADRWQNAIDTNPRTSVSTGSQFMGGGQPIPFEPATSAYTPEPDRYRPGGVYRPGQEQPAQETQPTSMFSTSEETAGMDLPEYMEARKKQMADLEAQRAALVQQATELSMYGAEYTEEIDDIKAQISAIDEQFAALQKPMTFKEHAASAGTAVVSGLESAGLGVTNALDWLFGEKSLPWAFLNELATLVTGQESPLAGKNPITALQRQGQQEVAYWQNQAAIKAAGNDVAEKVGKHAASIAQSSPFILMNLLSLGVAGTAAAGTTEGLSYVSTINSSPALQQISTIAAKSLEGLASNPTAQYSFVSTFGSSYQDALAEGATEAEATVYAMLNAGFGTIVEMCGGLEAMPEQLLNAMQGGGTSFALEYAKDIAHEIGEEEIQRVLELGLKFGYSDVEWLDQENPDAILNMGAIGETAVDTAIDTAIMGGAQTALQYGANAIVNAVQPLEQASEEDRAPTTKREAVQEQQAQEEAAQMPEAPAAQPVIPADNRVEAEDGRGNEQPATKREAVDRKLGEVEQEEQTATDEAAQADEIDTERSRQSAYDMGQSGVSANYLTEETAPGLSEDERRSAFEQGREDARETAATRAAAISDAQKSGNLSRVKGTVRGENVNMTDLRRTFNDSQNTAYRVLTKYAETTGVNVVLYSSQADDNGNYPEAQGRFQWKDDTIYIDINSGLFSSKDVNDLGKYTMLRTFSHEFTHFVEKWNAERYNEFREFVFASMEAKGENVNDLIESMQARDSSGEMTYEEASREVVADAMTDVLEDSQLVQRLANENPTLFQRLLRKLRQFAARVKQAYRNMTSASTREAQALKENGKYLDGIVKMWGDIAAEAVKNYQGAKGETVTEQAADQVTSKKEKTSKFKASRATRSQAETTVASKPATPKQVEASAVEEDDFSDINPAEVKAELKRRGIVGGQVVDPEKNAQSPFIQQVVRDTGTDAATIQREEATRKGSADAFMNGDIFSKDAVKKVTESKAASEIVSKMPAVPEAKAEKSVSKQAKTNKTVSAWKGGTPSQKAAYSILRDYLEQGKGLPSKALYAICDEAYGGTQAEGAYNRKDAYDAMELAVNRYLLDIMGQYNDGTVENAQKGLEKAQEILSLLPTQNVRTQEQQDFQQFSTPPSIAYLTAWAANINADDHVLEPSAGIGGLAAFAKAWGAEVTVNELSERRFGIIQAMGFDHYFNENAEQINNILPDNIQPSVVLMNPPFSATAGRTKNNKTSNAERHINQALARLNDGGRLVAVVGRGMSDSAYSKYWDKVRENYNIRANIGIDGENYKKYGTTFDVQIVVIDKTGPQGSDTTLTGSYTDLKQVPGALEGIRNDRSTEVERNAGIESNQPAAALAGEREPVRPAMDQAGADTRGERESDRGDHDAGRGGESGNADVQRGERGAEPVQDARSGERGAVEQQRPRKDVSENRKGTKQPAVRADERGAGTAANVQGKSGQQRGGSRAEPTRNGQVEQKAPGDDGIYANYKPPKLTTAGSRAHPAPLVESAAMAAVDMPKATYTPKLPADVVKNNLSDAQMVSVTYAGQAHEQKLPGGERRGFFIGDGTGVGKGRQISGIILDNFLQGRDKAVWISEKQSLYHDAVRDWTETTGRSKDEVHDLSKVKLQNAPDFSKGILYTTYDTLRTEKNGRSRVQQIADWFGKDYDGVIAFDEAHNMGNLLGRKGKFGKAKGSDKAKAAVELQRLLPNARVLYVSATAATEVDGLAFASRLGLWGKGTAFSDVNDFVSKIGSSGLAAMELVVRDMKAMGMYVARSISYNGVEYGTIQHDLDPVQRQIYDTMSRAWQSTMKSVEESLESTGAQYNSGARRLAIGQYYSAMQRFYNQVLTSMSMPSVIADMRKQLAAGRSCVLQIVNTNQAEANRQIANIKAEGGDLDSMDLTPRGTLIDYLEKSYPVTQYEEYTDDNGNTQSRPVLNSKGEAVIDKEALRKRDALIREIEQMSIPDGPLEMLFNAFGTDEVAEITGRTRRVVPKRQADGSVSRVEESRSPKAREADVNAFQNGDKRILVFNNAGGTGKSYHADLRAGNQQQRVHYVLQPGWEASRAVQGFGRTHRSNEASAPIYKLVTTDIKGQKRFTSTIARRLDQLGALTKGQRDTGSGMFGASDNLETDLAKDSLREFYRRLGKNNLEGIEGRDVLKRLGLLEKFTDEYGAFKLNDTLARDISTFLNRILALEVDEQNRVFDAFLNIYESEMEAAIAAGTLDRGMENVKADKIEIVDDSVIKEQKGSGAATHYVQAKVYTKPKVISTVAEAEKLRTGFVGIYRTKNGDVRAVYRIADKTTDWGEVRKQYRLQSPNRSKSSVWQETSFEKDAEAVPKGEWQAAWEKELAKVPAYNEETKHMLTGALLPIWDALPQEGSTKVQRLIASDGSTYLGRVIAPDQIDSVLNRFNVNRTKETFTPQSVMDKAIKDGTRFNLSYSRAAIFRSKVSGEWRLEYSQPVNSWAVRTQYPGLIMERINWQDRYFIPLNEKGAAILDQILENNPVSNISENGEEFSIRRQSLSNTEVLELAADQIDASKLSDAEKNALSIFQKRLDTLNEAQAQRAALGQQYREQQFQKGGSRAEAEKIRNRMQVMDGRIQRLQNEVVSLENKDVLRNVLNQARNVVERQEREKGASTLKQYRERRNESQAVQKYRARVRAQVLEFADLMTKPSNKDIRKHVPAEIQKTLVDFLDGINLSSKTALASSGLSTTKADQQYLKSMKKLHDAIKENVDAQGLYSGYADLPPNFLDDFSSMIRKAEELMENSSGTFIVNQMNGAELKELSKTLRTLKKFITTMNKFHNNAMFQHVDEAGESTVTHLNRFDKSKSSGSVYKFLRFDYMRPSLAFEHFGEGGKSIEHEFRAGQATQAMLADTVIDFAKNTFNGKEVKLWSENVKEFTLSGGEKISLPVTHIMSLYCLSKRAQAQTHIYGDGIRVANYKANGKVQLDDGHIVSTEDVQKMIDSLTPRQIEVADALQKFMSTECAQWGNYVSIARFDVEQFTEPNYFPINSDGRYLPATADESPDNAGLYALLNMGFTKELKENAKNRIILYNVFDVFANHAASMTQYRSFALPVLDALKWFNYKDDVTSVRDQLARAFGAPEETRAGSGSKGYAESFIINLIRAYNGTAAQGDPYDAGGLKALHRFNRAQIAFNLRVVAQQPMAITRAAMILDAGQLMKSLEKGATKANAEEMERYSGIAKWKSFGFFDTNISRGLTELIKQTPTFGERVTEAGTKGAELADRFTWAAIWDACKNTVKRGNYTTEEAYFQAVTDLFEDVIYKTQVVDSVLTKSEFMRAKGFFPRMMGSFMSEPMTTVSMLTDAYYKYQDDRQTGSSRSEAWKKNAKNIRRTFVVYAVGQVMLAAAQAFMDAWRDEDEYDEEHWFSNYFQKWLNAFKSNVIEELLPFGKIPYVSEMYEISKQLLDYAGVFDKWGLDLYGNDISNGWAQYAKYLIKGSEILIDKARGKQTNYTGWGAAYNLMRATSGLIGYPFATLTREVVDAWNNTVGYFAPRMAIKTYESAIDRQYNETMRGTGVSKAQYEKILTEADVDGEWASPSQDELGAYLQNAIKAGTVTKAHADAVWASRGWKPDHDLNWWTEKQKSVPKTATGAVDPAYADYKKNVSIYDKDGAYEGWKANLEQRGVGLDEFTNVINKANTDGNTSLRQDELGEYLYNQIQNKRMTEEEANAWFLVFWNGQRSKTYTKWAAKNKK